MAKSSKVNKQFECAVCGRRFVTLRGLNAHLAEKHPIKKSKPKRRQGMPESRSLTVVRGSTQMSPTNEKWDGSYSPILRNIRSEMCGSTDTGREWFMRAMDPCDKTRAGGAGIPDLTAGQTSNIELRHNQVLAAPAGLPDGTNWDVQFVFLPLIDVPVVYRTRPSTTSSWNDWLQMAPTQGQILSGSIKPYQYLGVNNAQTQDFSIPSVPSLQTISTGFRQTFKGVTIVMNSNSLTNQGIVTFAETLKESRLTKIVAVVGDPPTEPAKVMEAMDVLAFPDVPSEPDELIQVCGNAGQWEARKGIYAPLKFAQPTHPYNGATGAPIESKTDGQPNITEECGLPIMLLPVGQDAAVETYGKYFVSKLAAPTDTNAEFTTSAGTINQTVGTAIFSGLDKKAMLMVKTRTGVELQPEVGNALSLTAVPAPRKDDVALNMVQSVQREMPLVYEHRYNSAGLLLPLIGKVLASIAPTVLPWIGNKLSGLFSRKAPSKYIEEPVD